MTHAMPELRIPYQKQIVSTTGLTTGYIGRKVKRAVSKDLSLGIRNGELVALLGPNGCGKSTLMRTMGGLQKPLSGAVHIGGLDVRRISPAQRARYLSLVLTEKVDSTNLTIDDIVSIGRYPYVGYMGRLTPEDWDIVNRSLEICSLGGWGKRVFSELSDGEKQRVMIARALAQDTPFMLLDEPTAHLDLPNRIEMMRMLNQLAKKTGKAILVSTHELDLAMQWADTVWLMDMAGEVFSGIPEDVVLSGKVAGVFCNAHFYFDMKSGNFKMNRNHTIPVSVRGEGVATAWTIRALERTGFTVLPERGDTHIDVSPGEWVLTVKGAPAGSFVCVGELLTALQTEGYWERII